MVLSGDKQQKSEKLIGEAEGNLIIPRKKCFLCHG